MGSQTVSAVVAQGDRSISPSRQDLQVVQSAEEAPPSAASYVLAGQVCGDAVEDRRTAALDQRRRAVYFQVEVGDDGCCWILLTLHYLHATNCRLV